LQYVDEFHDYHLCLLLIVYKIIQSSVKKFQSYHAVSQGIKS